MLTLYRERERGFTSAEVSKRLYIQPESAQARLSQLVNDGLLAADAGEYRFAAPETLEKIVAELERTYPERRVTIINLIFSKPLDRIKSFSDAFKLKKEEE